MKIGRREKRFLIGGAAVLVVVLCLQIFVFPFFDSKERLEMGIVGKGKALKEMEMLRTEYLTLQRGSSNVKQQLERRAMDFTLFSFLEIAADKSSVKTNIKYMKPSEATTTGPFKESHIEIKLEAVSLQRLIDYLRLIESDEQVVSVKRISIQESKKENGSLDVILQVLTFH